MTIVWMPPERNDPSDTVAAKRTIAAHSSGRDSRDSYWMRNLSGRKLRLFSDFYQAGSSQNDTEKRVPRASVTRSGVRYVDNR